METYLRRLLLSGRIGGLSFDLQPLWVLAELIGCCLLEGKELAMLNGCGLLTAVIDGCVTDLIHILLL